MAGTGASLSLGPRSAVLLLAFVQGLVGAGLLVRRARRRRVVADLLLAAILVVCCGDLTSHLIGWAGAYDRWPDLSFFPFGSNFAIGPLVWFHTRSLVEGGFRFRRRDLVHAVPFILEKTYYLWAWSHPLPWKNAFDGAVHVPIVVPIIKVLEAGQTGAYLVLAIAAYRRYRRWVDDAQSDAGLRLEWLQRLLYVAVAGFAAGQVMSLADAFTPIGYRGWFTLYVLIGALTYYLSIAGLLAVPDPAPGDAPHPPAPDALPAPPAEPAPAAPPTPPELVEWTARVARLMADERPWLDPRLTLADLARRLNTNASALSGIINDGFHQNFNDYVNGHRVRAVQERLRTGEGDRRGLLAVAFDCGFNAKSTFNRAFRKATGVAPSEFREREAAQSTPEGLESS